MPDLSQLELFTRVVETGSFTAAAAQLGVSKSFVSRQLGALEDRLGARLLHRTTRKVTLTDVGRVFHQRCARILEELEDAELAVSNLQNHARGTLRISAPMSFGVRYVAPVVASFMRQHPELTVDIDFSDRRVDLVEEGFDVAVRIGRLADSSFVARKLAESQTVIVASEAYLEARGVPRTPYELREHACLRYAYQSGGAQTWQLEGPGGKEVAIHVHGRAISNNGDALLEAAMEGLGIALAPDFLACRALREGRLRRILTDWGWPTRVWAVYPHSRHLSAKVRLFVEHLREVFQGPTWSER